MPPFGIAWLSQLIIDNGEWIIVFRCGLGCFVLVDVAGVGWWVKVF